MLETRSNGANGWVRFLGGDGKLYLVHASEIALVRSDAHGFADVYLKNGQTTWVKGIRADDFIAYVCAIIGDEWGSWAEYDVEQDDISNATKFRSEKPNHHIITIVRHCKLDKKWEDKRMQKILEKTNREVEANE